MSEENVTPLEDQSAEESQPRLNQEVNVESRGACERHITVSVSVEDVQRYFDKELTSLLPDVQLHGFRPGRAPRNLVEKQYQKELSQRVKANLLQDSIEQVNEDQKLAPISEPNFNIESIELVKKAPFVFEFDLEVRPEFDLPQWHGLELNRPVREFSDKDVDYALESYMASLGELVPIEGPAQECDFVVVDLKFEYNGNVISSAKNERIRVRPTLSFRDTQIKDFGQLMVGAQSGDVRTTTAVLSDDAPNPLFRSKEVTATFEVKDVKRLELPEITPELLEQLGGFESEAEMREAVLEQLNHQMEYNRYQQQREEICQQLLANADWDLPRDMLQRQSTREMYRTAMEMKRAGYSDQEILAVRNQMEQNSREATAKALKEHFIFERIAEDENIDATEEEYEAEIEVLALNAGESPRRIRARIERENQMDALRNQIVEHKVVQMILDSAKFTEVPYLLPGDSDTEHISVNAGGEGDDEPKAEEAQTEDVQTEEAQTEASAEAVETEKTEE